MGDWAYSVGRRRSRRDRSRGCGTQTRPWFWVVENGLAAAAEGEGGIGYLGWVIGV